MKKRYLSGPQTHVDLDSSKGLIRIGERLNVRGSKKVREAVENESGSIDYDALEEVVSEQTNDLGIDIIDVCMDSNLVNTKEVLPDIIHKLTVDLKGAMCIDSFDVEALLKAVQTYPGRPLINSISLEEYQDGISKIEAICPETAFHNPMYIALCTGPKGPAATREDKVELTRQIINETAKYDIQPDQLIVDMNVFPIGSESDESMNFALETLESIPMIKDLHPDLMTSMGVGNLTNGLAKKPYMRRLLTSVFIEEGRKRGLDAAIINPHHYVPVESLDKDDVERAMRVIFDRDMDAFAELEEIAEKKAGRTVQKKSNYDDLEVKDSICQKIIDGYKQREKGAFQLEGMEFEYIDKIVLQVKSIIGEIEPLDFINDYLMKSMGTLGDGFAAGNVSLPHLLKSADVMKQVMGFLESYMKKKAGTDLHDQIDYKGTIVMGTVYQDVHSIGKDLAKTLLENYGYRTIDLGVQVPLQKFVDTAKEHQADAIGMSALLVQTSNHMITVCKMLEEAGLNNIDILIGGAPISNRHAGYVAMYDQADLQRIKANVFYCPSGMDGVNHMNALVGERREKYVNDNKEVLLTHYKRAKKIADETEQLLETLDLRKIDLSQHPEADTQKFFKSKKVEIDLKTFASLIDKKTLYGLNWSFGGKASREKKGMNEAKMEELFESWIQKCSQNGWVKPQGVYGLYPCQSSGNDVILYDIDDIKTEIARFDFSTVIGSDKKDKVCAAHYYHSIESGKMDMIGLQLTTGGNDVDQTIEKLKQDGDSESSLLLQGLSDRIAEDMADYVHQELRKLAGVNPKEGTRYSPGYPAIRNLDNNRKILEILNGTELLGITNTDAGEFHPTGSTGAISSFFKDASYQ